MWDADQLAIWLISCMLCLALGGVIGLVVVDLVDEECQTLDECQLPTLTTIELDGEILVCGTPPKLTRYGVVLDDCDKLYGEKVNITGYTSFSVVERE